MKLVNRQGLDDKPSNVCNYTKQKNHLVDKTSNLSSYKKK